MDARSKWGWVRVHPLAITSKETYHTIAARSLLQDSEVSLKIYTGDSIPVLGSALVQVEHGGEQIPLLVHVVPGSGPNLMGRDWLGKLVSLLV